MTERRPARTLGVLVGLVVVAIVVHVGVGSYLNLPPWAVVREILAGPGGESPVNSTVWDIRLPRALVCLFAGGLLGAVGSAFQALFRNPLADPFVVGVSSGAAIGGAIAIALGVGSAWGNLGVAAAGFPTGVATLFLVYGLARRRGVVDVSTLLLAGSVVGSMLSAGLSMVLLLAGKDTNDVLRWLLGNTSAANWPKVALLGISLAAGAAALMRESRRLNAFAFGGEAARRLGVDVRRLTRTTLLIGGAMTAAAVGAVGIIGFLGLVAPHIARRLVGVDWRWSLPGSLLVGSLLLVASDIVAQRGLSLATHTVGMDVPVGVVTALLGAPSLLILLRRVPQG